MAIAYTAAKIFTGNEWLNNHSVIINDGRIEDVISTANVPAGMEQVNYEQHYIVPAFIDNQIYGAAGMLLAVYPTAEALHKLYDYCVAGGSHHFLPTVATNEYPVFYSCIDAIKAYWNKGGKGVLGLHIEGPWINEAKRGAHIQHLIHAPTIEEARELLEYGKDVIKMITLAPEVCNTELIDLVESYGVIVAAGHTDASFAEATNAFNNGIGTVTHLYNAMSPLQHRQPGVVGAVFQHPTVMASIIPDGYHVNFEAIAIAKKIMGNRLYMITDAVTHTNKGPYPHQMEGDKYVSNGILSGSALTILKGVKNCVEQVGIELGEALRMASLYPAKVMLLQHELGCIAKGYRGEMLVLSNALEIQAHITS